MAEMEIDDKSEADLSGEEHPQLPETLIAGRQRRSTAGNRLAQLLQQEQPDDIDLLFEENDEEDDEFQAKHESDVDLGSSSDEEDKPQEQDELAGEKALEREEKASKRQKRAKGAFPGQKELDKLVQRQQNLREKRVTIQEPEDTIPTTPTDQHVPRARKKSERISWIPTAEDQPSRQSTRRQTVANKQMIHERMKESNERRLKVIAAMEASTKKKKKVELTQEMRLERAKKVEEKNKKSLNKWQEAEEARLAAQRAKLAALHNRKIEGPFIRFYSGRAEYDASGALISVGRRKLVEELPPPGEKKLEEKKPEEGKPDTEKPEGEKTEGEKPEGEKPEGGKPEGENQEGENPEGEKPEGERPNRQEPEERVAEEKSVDAPTSVDEIRLDEDVTMEDAPQDSPLATEVTKPVDVNDIVSTEPPASNEVTSQEQPQSRPSKPSNPQQAQTYALVPSDADGSSDDTQHKIAAQLQGDLDASQNISKAEIKPATVRILEGFSRRELANKELASKVFFPYNKGPLPKPDRSLCVTTSLPARYKDPSTGLPYANLFAYRQIQRVKDGGLRWNSELQCFIDSQEAASGVPEGFYA